MSAVLQPILDLEKQLDDAKAKATETLLKKRAEIDEQLARLGYGVRKRGRPPQK